VPNVSKRRTARKPGRKFYAKTFSLTLEQIAYVDGLPNASEWLRNILDQMMLDKVEGEPVEIVSLRAQLETLEIMVRKEEKERDHVLHTDETWDAWRMENGQYVLDADRNLIPKTNREWNPHVQSALESYKAHNKKVGEMQKKIEQIKAILSEMTKTDQAEKSIG